MRSTVLAALAGASMLSDTARSRDVTIPFELINKTVFIRVMVKATPLWFVLDTGDKYAVVDMGVATALGLDLGDPVTVTGGGKDAVAARLVRSGDVSVVGLEGSGQPLVIALPLDKLANASGHEFAGILGGDFLRQFVVEIDYMQQSLTLHDTTTYVYRGAGDVLPITFNAAGHPQVTADVLDGDRSTRKGTFVLDIGSGAALILNTPFVDSERLLTGNRRTVPWLEGRGIGGGVEGVVGRITAFKLGREWIENPVTVFARAGAGPFAASEAQGNIGAAILEKFKVILDYNHLRIILEPNARFREPLEYNRTGLSLVSFGPDYKRFQIDAVAEHSPAADAGVQSGDMLVAIDGRAAEEFTLSEVRLHFKDAKWCTLTIQRGDSRLQRRLELQRSI